MKIIDVLNLNNDLSMAYNLMTETEFADKNAQKEIMAAISDAMQLCRYIYNNTDVMGVTK